MKKQRTIFEGIVNGEKFNNIDDYNTRVNKLMQNGEFMSASSSTKVEEYEENSEAINNLLNAVNSVDALNKKSFFPYMEKDNDTHYINRLLANNNIEEMNEYLDKCYTAILEELFSEYSTLSYSALFDYLDNISDIIKTIKDDESKNDNALASLEAKHAELTNELTTLEEKLNVLDNAKVIIDNMLVFYETLEEQVTEAINNRRLAYNKNTCNCGKCNCDGKCNCTCKEDTGVTSLKEVSKQYEVDLNKLINEVFGRKLF